MFHNDVLSCEENKKLECASMLSRLHKNSELNFGYYRVRILTIDETSIMRR